MVLVALCSFQRSDAANAASQPNMPFRKGDDGGGDTPLPIPNREVKPASADGTAGETLWESRSSPIFLCIGFRYQQSARSACDDIIVRLIRAKRSLRI